MDRAWSACSSAVKEAVRQLVGVTPENNKKIASGVDRGGCCQGPASVYWQPPGSGGRSSNKKVVL